MDRIRRAIEAELLAAGPSRRSLRCLEMARLAALGFMLVVVVLGALGAGAHLLWVAALAAVGWVVAFVIVGQLNGVIDLERDMLVEQLVTQYGLQYPDAGEDWHVDPGR